MKMVYADDHSSIYKINNIYFRIGVGIFGVSVERYKDVSDKKKPDEIIIEKINEKGLRIFKSHKKALDYVRTIHES